VDASQNIMQGFLSSLAQLEVSRIKSVITCELDEISAFEAGIRD
jgi:hypothetical protein